MLRRLIELRQYTSIFYSDCVDAIGAAPFIGTVGDSFDNTLAEWMFSIFKTQLFRNPAVLKHHGGRWEGLDELDDQTPTEVEAHYAEQSQTKAA